MYKSISKDLNFLAYFLTVTVIIFLSIGVAFPLVADAASCTTPNPSYGTDTMTAVVPSTTTYTLWVNMLAASSTSNSVLVQVNSSSCFNAGGSSSLSTSSWTWVNYQNGSSSQKMQIPLNSGDNTIELIGSSPGVGVSNILLLADPNCIPTGDGTNCTTNQSASVTNPSSPSGASSSSGNSSSGGSSNSSNLSLNSITANAKPVVYTGKTLTLDGAYVQLTKPVTITPTYIAGKKIQKVQYYLNKSLIYTATKSPYTYKLNTNKLENGKYLLNSKTTYTSNQVYVASEAININHSFFANLFIFVLNNIILFIFILIVIAVGIWQIVIHKEYLRSLLKRKDSNQPIVAIDTNPRLTSPYTAEDHSDGPLVIAPNDPNIDNNEENPQKD